MGVGALHHGAAALDGLAQRLDGLALELGQPVEEQDAEMGERDLAGPRPRAAADHRRQRRRMMRVAERPAPCEAAVGQAAGDALDHAHLEHLGRGERRQQPRQASGEQGLAGARRADHQQVVASGRRHLQRPLRGLLALDVGQVGIGRAVVGQRRFGRAHHLAALEVVDQGQQAGSRQHLGAARPGRLAAVGLRADGAATGGRGADRRRQHPGNRQQRAVEAELPEHGEGVHRVAGHRPHADQQAERDGQVEVAALLQQIGRRQVDGDALGRQRQAQGAQRRAHPLARFGHRLVGQADHGECRQPRGDMHLDVDVARLDAVKCDRVDMSDHPPRALPHYSSARV